MISYPRKSKLEFKSELNEFSVLTEGQSHAEVWMAQVAGLGGRIALPLALPPQVQ